MKTCGAEPQPTTLILVAILAGGVSARSRGTETHHSRRRLGEHVMRLTPAELTWTAGPPMLPPGASMAVIEGSFSKPGPFTVRLRFPANYRIRRTGIPQGAVTVLSGSFNMGFGDELDTEREDAAARQHLREISEDPPFWLDHRGDDHPGARDRAPSAFTT